MSRFAAKAACTLSIASLSALALTGPAAAPASASASAAAAKCVISGPAGDTTFTKLRGISCGSAKSVGQRAYKKGGDAMLCASKRKFEGWTVRHTSSMFIQATFSKGSKRFTMDVQGGAC